MAEAEEEVFTSREQEEPLWEPPDELEEAEEDDGCADVTMTGEAEEGWRPAARRA